ncbi:MAG TPA: DUF3037 domain-containing protein [Terriglobales bacterium]|jgi:hypothetical protein|nr:DUF3037 domain-containing protein [Terriglobales bacterium]
MGNWRQLELYPLQLLLHALRGDFVTIGFVLIESDGGFAQVRLTRDWKMLQCVAPHLEWEWFGTVESDLLGKLGRLRTREELVNHVSERFGTVIEVGPTKGVLTDDPVKEMEVLTGMYLLPTETVEPVRRRTGRAAILYIMEQKFKDVSVLELLQRDLDLVRYTGPGDPLRIDFSYRIGSAVKMFHAVSMATSAEPALALAFRYSRVDEGMRREQLHASLTVVVDEEAVLQEDRARFAVGMLEQNSVRVKTIGEMAEIAAEVRRDLRV